MSDLQATIEFSVELCKFYNVDLFQRGLYQVRTVLRASPKLPVQVEASIPDSGSSASVLGQSTGASRTFQILYRNEEVTLRDIVHYRAHLLVDTRHIQESLKRAEFTIIVELWFSEQSMNGASCTSGLTQVSTRTLQLNFCPMKGLHYHLPILFDYFHLAAVSLTVHANLVALHQPYIKTNCTAPLNFISTPRGGKPWLNKNPSRMTAPGTSTSQNTMETVLIGSVKCGGNSTKIAHARQVHQEVCSLLLSSLEALRNTILEYSIVLPHWQQLPSGTGSGQNHVDSAQRLRKIADLAKFMDSEDDFLARANSDIAQLCAENILQWRHFLEAASQPLIHQLLAKKHHQLRVKRFAEAFFVLVNPRHSAAGCYDANHQYYLSVTELARTRYLSTLPPLPIHCAALDGDPSNIPIIFEDQYEDNVEFTRRRSGGSSRRADSEPFLSAVVSETQPPAPKDCSCGISAILEARSPRTVGGNGCNPNTSPLAALMEPRIIIGGDVLQASISIAPQQSGRYRTCKTAECERKTTQRGNIQNNRSLSRYSASTLLDIVAGQEPGYLPIEPPCIGASSTLPARHSKSLDQLKCPNGAINGVIVNTTLPRALPQYTTRPQAEDLMKNITEFREKYKNPGDVHNVQLDRCHRNDRIPTSSIRMETTPRYNTVDRVVRCNPNKEFDYRLSTLPRQHGLPPRNSYPPIRVKKQYSDTSAEIIEPTVMNGATRRTNIPRSSSTQLLRNNCREWEIATPQSSVPDCVPCRTKHTKHSRTRAYKSHAQTDISEPGSSSSDSDSINRKKLGASASVPFRLEALEVEVPNSSNPVAFSESLPNLAPPPAFESSPIRKHSTSESTSSLSEQSGWVSSRRSSAPSSPELPRRFESRKFNTLLNGTKDPTVLNGEQLRKKLEQLAVSERFREVPKSKVDRPIYGVIQSNGSVAVMSTSSRPQPGRSKDVKPPTNNRRREEYCWNSNGHYIPNEKPNRQTRSKSSHCHDANAESKMKPLENRITNEINRIMMETPLTDKAKSDFDLTLMDHSYEEVRLPPPQQFRDVPPPPDEFRDPPPNNPEAIQLPISIDNPLYHVYESVNKCRERPVIKSQSSNELTAMVNVVQPRPLSATPKQNSKLESQSNNSRTKHKNSNQMLKLDGEVDSTASVIFSKCRDDFKRQMNYSGEMYSDRSTFASELPYFHISDEYRMFSPAGVHLIVCVHGLDGNSADLRLVKTYLELGLPGAHLEFLMSERNQGDTFSDFDTMTDRLVGEILYHIEALGLNPTRISFVGHSLGTIIVRSALARPQMRPLLSRLHTFLSLSGPHLGTLYNSSGLVNMGMWFMQKWKKSGSLLQLCLRDAADVRQSFLYRLSQRSTLHRFRHVLLCGSSQDRYVPLHSARLELCKAAVRDVSPLGTAYREMVHNIVAPMLARRDLTLARFDAHHALPHTANALIGRAAHIAVLDSELFLEKFLLVAALKYFS